MSRNSASDNPHNCAASRSISASMTRICGVCLDPIFLATAPQHGLVGSYRSTGLRKLRAFMAHVLHIRENVKEDNSRCNAYILSIASMIDNHSQCGRHGQVQTAEAWATSVKSTRLQHDCILGHLRSENWTQGHLSVSGPHGNNLSQESSTVSERP